MSKKGDRTKYFVFDADGDLLASTAGYPDDAVEGPLNITAGKPVYYRVSGSRWRMAYRMPSGRTAYAMISVTDLPAKLRRGKRVKRFKKRRLW